MGRILNSEDGVCHPKPFMTVKSVLSVAYPAALWFCESVFLPRTWAPPPDMATRAYWRYNSAKCSVVFSSLTVVIRAVPPIPGLNAFRRNLPTLDACTALLNPDDKVVQSSMAPTLPRITPSKYLGKVCPEK